MDFPDDQVADACSQLSLVNNNMAPPSKPGYEDDVQAISFNQMPSNINIPQSMTSNIFATHISNTTAVPAAHNPYTTSFHSSFQPLPDSICGDYGFIERSSLGPFKSFKEALPSAQLSNTSISPVGISSGPCQFFLRQKFGAGLAHAHDPTSKVTTEVEGVPKPVKPHCIQGPYCNDRLTAYASKLDLRDPNIPSARQATTKDVKTCIAENKAKLKSTRRSKRKSTKQLKFLQEGRLCHRLRRTSLDDKDCNDRGPKTVKVTKDGVTKTMSKGQAKRQRKQAKKAQECGYLSKFDSTSMQIDEQ